MATQEEILKIRFQAEGDAAIKRAQAELDKLEKAAARAAQKFRDGTLDEQRFGKAAEVMGQKVAVARANLEAYQRAAGQKSSRNLGMAALEAGRALEDLNYGLMGVINNIPQLAMALGAGAGLTGVIGVLGAATLFLYNNWSRVADVFAVGIPNDTISSLQRAKTELEEVNKQLEELAAKPRISIAEKIRFGTLSIERDDLQRQINRDEAIDSAFEGKSDSAQSTARTVNDLIRNSGLSRADLTGMLVKGVGELGGSEAVGMGGIGSKSAARELLGAALQGDAFSAGQLQRALGAAGGAGTSLARSLGVGLAGNPSAADYGPDRSTLDAGLAERESERKALGLDAASYGPDRSTLEAGLAERQRRADELAGPLQGRFDAASLEGRVLTQDQVRGELERSGVGADEASTIAGDVLKALMTAFDARVTEAGAVAGEDRVDAEARLGAQGRLDRRGEALRRRRELLADQVADRPQGGRPSQTIDASSFAQAIQSGITGGPDIGRQQLQRLDKLIAINERQARDLRDVGRLR